MRGAVTASGWLLLAWLLLPVPDAMRAAGQARGEDGTYKLSVPVDEVSLVFHAEDFHGLPVEDLTAGDLRLYDNGKRQEHFVSFQQYRDLPILAGVLFDTSRSMGWLRRNQEIAELYVARLLRKDTDEAFVMRFDSEAKVRQGWTNDAQLLTASLEAVGQDRQSRLGGTALFDALYIACRDQWANADAVTGNFILLFTDGVDNASHARMEDVIDRCQKTRTAIYVFSERERSRFDEGQKTLEELTQKSGGSVFYDASEDAVWNDLQLMESEQRGEYRIVYKPAHLTPDGSFHRLRLESPSRGGVIRVRSGYYASR